MANDPDIEIICEAPGGTYRGTIIREKSGGYRIESMNTHPTGEYDPKRFRMERDPASTPERERWRLVERKSE